MYPVDRADIGSYLKKLNVSKNLLNLCNCKSSRENAFGVMEPYKVYSSYAMWDDDEVYTFLPLWESGTEVFAFDLEKKNYFVFSLETLKAPPYFVSSTLTGLIAFLLSNVIESELDELKDKNLKRLKTSQKLAQSFDFPFLDELAICIVSFQEKWAAGLTVSMHDELMEFCRKHAI